MSRPQLTLLVDNGSLQPAATLVLRDLAAKLSARINQPVEAISLLHSSGIDPKLIDGRPAEILFPALERRLADGQNEFVIVPLFFGPSHALTVYIPENIERLRKKFPALRVTIAPPSHASDDTRLAQILADHVSLELEKTPGVPTRIALVDHGSPTKSVTAVRNELAHQLAAILGPRVITVAACSMERRPDPAYDFCDPLLAALLERSPWPDGRVIIAMQFLLPGRHAGPDGDVAKICTTAESAHPDLRTTMTKLVAEHPLLIAILADRWRALR
ncbi:MAG TPA: cobalamin biosynthesis protein CbiX [Lacunisphaera sp.]|jgi:sirohydrochlorin ferrochelatase